MAKKEETMCEGCKHFLYAKSVNLHGSGCGDADLAVCLLANAPVNGLQSNFGFTSCTHFEMESRA